MTREEAIEAIKEVYGNTEYTDGIIKALEQEPCEDAISRQAVFDLIADYDLSMGQVVKGVHALPSAQPEIIKCKDCKHYQFADNRAFGMPVKMCEWFGFEDVDDDDFCSRADKKSDFCPNCGSDNRGEQE